MSISKITSRRGPTLDEGSPKPPSKSPNPEQRVFLAWFSLCYHHFKALQGYHSGVTLCAVVTSVVAVLNVAFLAWALGKSGLQSGLGTLLDGSCRKANNLTRWLHLTINILGTSLLGASNYSMQHLSSPKRTEVNKAHTKGISLDIRVPSISNVKRISALRLIQWSLIAVSSIPLHLLYNSAVLSTLPTRQYNVFLVSDDFLDDATFNLSSILPYGGEIDGERIKFSG